MNKIYDFFDDSYYINLDNRIDRREKIEKRLKEVNIKSKRFSAIQPDIKNCTHVPYWKDHKTQQEQRLKSNEVGCALSHKGIISIAKDLNLDNILIFEDDCVFLDGFEKSVKKIISDIKKYNIDWDIIYFGGEPNNNCERITDNVYIIPKGGIYGLQSYAVNNKFFNKILNMNFNNCSIIDIFLLNYNPNERKYILSKKLLTEQETNYSDLRDQIVKTPHFKKGWDRFVK